MSELSDVDLLLSGQQPITEQEGEPVAPPNTSEPEPDMPADTPESPEEAPQLDDYGNDTPAPKMYTEEEVRERINKAIRKRLKDAESAPQMPQQQPQQPQYQPQSVEEDWQVQLKEFVRATLQEDAPNIIQQQQEREQQRQHAIREKVLQQQFEERFVSGMERFNDFQQVVGQQPITDAMTYALRGVSDPASFIYAASKRHADELARIAQIPDAYGQVVEMGRLEERMRKAKSTTTTPAPLTKVGGSVAEKQSKPKASTIDDLLAASDAKRLAESRRVR